MKPQDQCSCVGEYEDQWYGVPHAKVVLINIPVIFINK